MPYTALQKPIDAANPTGMRTYWTTDVLVGLPDEAIDMICRRYLTVPSQILIVPGGAIAKILDATAFG
jgi:hypothetical protein